MKEEDSSLSLDGGDSAGVVAKLSAANQRVRAGYSSNLYFIFLVWVPWSPKPVMLLQLVLVMQVVPGPHPGFTGQ